MTILDGVIGEGVPEEWCWSWDMNDKKEPIMV